MVSEKVCAFTVSNHHGGLLFQSPAPVFVRDNLLKILPFDQDKQGWLR
jgi:hypothetical protein